MREIKFRAWDKKTSNIYPVSALHSNGAVHIDVYPTKGPEYKGNKDDFELMQFTGLHDKNGKEIYEGDIVKTINGNWIVEWYQEDAMFRLIKGVYQSQIHFNGQNSYEIIGNIYQNPELIHNK